MDHSLEIRRKQVLYRAHYRGFREADLIIGGFAKENVPTMSIEELSEFESLLDLNDHDLYNWLMGKAEPPADILGPVFERLKTYDVAEITAPKQ